MNFRPLQSLRTLRSNRLLAPLAALLCFASACSPKVTSRLPAGSTLPAHIALLPADYSLDIPRERIDLVRGEIVSELRNHNFIVAEEKIVKSVCSSPACPERARLRSQYLVEAFATLSIDSFSKNNFVAGYYNQLSGRLSLLDPHGTELIAVDYTQSEKGGLLFNSGQIFQGIISQVNNSGDAAYQELASEFAKSVVEQLPAPVQTTAMAQREGLELALQSATAEWNSPTSYTVCLKGTPHSFASLLIGSNQATLRETSPGSYCSAFSALVASTAGTPATVELRSVFGNSERRELTLPARSPCALEERVQSSPDHIAIRCALVGQDVSRVQAGCSETIKACNAEKLVLYTATSEAGPFEKWREAASSSTTIAGAPGPIHVVAVGSGGIPSLPVQIPTQNTSTR